MECCVLGPLRTHVKFVRAHQCTSFLEYGEYPYYTSDEIKKALKIKADFDKYTEDAVVLFRKVGIDTAFENLEEFPTDWKTNTAAFPFMDYAPRRIRSRRRMIRW